MNAKVERRQSEGVTMDGNTLVGVVMPYGREGVHGGQRERFEPGAFGDTESADVILNASHDRTRPLARTGAGLELRDGAENLEMRATLPDTQAARDAIELVKTGVLRGLSVEFIARRETRSAGVRVIKAAKLVAIGLVDTPAYDDATVAARHAEPVAASPAPWWL